jgi:AcrR family transcriptional regulator
MARRPRRDAQENRERLVEVAARLFAEHGLDAAPAAVAREAGVGVGTLYRHFPTREALVDAAYRHQLTAVCTSAADLLRTRPTGAAALHAWMLRFLDYATAKNGMSEALSSAIASGADPFADSHALLVAAVTDLLAAGRADATLRADVDPDDVLLLLGGTALTVDQHGTREQAHRLVGLLLDALVAR